MRKIVALVLGICMVLSLCACGNKGQKEYEKVEAALQGVYSHSWYASFIQKNCYVGYKFDSGVFEYVSNSALLAQGVGVYIISTEDKTITCKYGQYADDLGRTSIEDDVFTYEFNDTGELVLKKIGGSDPYTKEK